jgi:tetratricopeptide (TPR) repeat protein
MVSAMRGVAFGIGCLLIGLSACALPQPMNPANRAWNRDPELPQVAESPFGRTYQGLSLDTAATATAEENLVLAWQRHETFPTSEDAVVWVGRRLAYLGRYHDAIAVYSRGLDEFPGSPQLLRHRGHRHITLFEIDAAINDLRRAAARTAGSDDIVEADGQPNAAGIPRGTLKSNIWYHLGLAFWLQGELDLARHAYERCQDFSRVNDDMLVAASYWLYMTLMRLGDEDQAAGVLAEIQPDMDILENHAYHVLLLMFKGERTAEQVLEGVDTGSLEFCTRGYGVANARFFAGDDEGGRRMLLDIVDTDGWPAFGFIAAELDLARDRP